MMLLLISKIPMPGDPETGIDGMIARVHAMKNVC